ncbi:MAG: FlgD immunoglobulin-like domain containing protein, partial [Spirochaetaceae bacterium]
MKRKHLMRLGLMLVIGFAVALPVFAGGAQEEEAAEIEMRRQPRQYISPDASSGTQDVLELPFPSVQLPAEDLVVVEYNLTVFDGDGEVVWSQSQVEEERVGFFGGLFGAEKPSVDVPDNLIWDGTYQNSDLGADGEYVPDGDYAYQLSITDDEGNVARTPPFGVTVDNTPPEVVTITDPNYQIFSPNDDGIRDTITFEQQAGREQAWTGQILGADGDVVWQETWGNPDPADRAGDVEPPLSVTWDGTYNVGSEAGDTVPEGDYRYRLSSEDRAGNSTTVEAQWTVTMSLRAGDVILTVTDEDPIFSPNGDGVQDTLTVSIELAEPEGVDDWEIEVAPEDDPNNVLRSLTGRGVPPEEITYNGRDEVGNVLDDGVYSARMTVEYENGNIVSSEPIGFTVDTTAPEAQVSVQTIPQPTDQEDPLVFGGTNKQGLELTARISEEQQWYAVISDQEDEIRAPIEEYGLSGPRFTVEWDGTMPDGSEAPDGVYSLYLESTDRAGNYGRSQEIRARKDTRETPIDIEIGKEVITPNDDGVDDSVEIRPQFEVADGIDEFLLAIRDERGRVVRTQYKRTPFEVFEWQGRNNAGGRVPDGDYTVDFRIIYYNGNEPEITGAGPINVTTPEVPDAPPATPPNIRIAVSPLPFSPDDDGVNDELRIRLVTRSLTAIERWSLRILDPMGNLLRSWSDTGEPPALIRWNGRARDGELVQSAETYKAVFEVEDAEGFVVTEEADIPIDILVMKEDDRYRIRVPSIRFAPYTSDLFDVEQNLLDENLETLRRLAEILERYPDREITIEGHAVHIYWEPGSRRDREQEEVLVPLSRNRAQEVKEALIILGIERDRMDVVGFGGARPIVPHNDEENRWKNRRVEFILER